MFDGASWREPKRGVVSETGMDFEGSAFGGLQGVGPAVDLAGLLSSRHHQVIRETQRKARGLHKDPSALSEAREDGWKAPCPDRAP